MLEIEEIKKEIKKSIEAGAKPIAAFDADGTLWNTDMGEVFFEYQIKTKSIENLREDAWKHYFYLKENTSPQAAYLWLAQINKGKQPSEILGYSKDCVRDKAVPYFEFQKEIITYLQSLNVEIFIVTASIRYAVAAAAEYFKIPFDHILGVDVEVENGYLTDKQRGCITWREGKTEALLKVTKGERPFFCSGNTMGDLSLLESSNSLRLVIAKASQESLNYSTEQELLKIAKKRGWFYCD